MHCIPLVVGVLSKTKYQSWAEQVHQEAFLSKQHSLQRRYSAPTLCAYDTQTGRS